MIDKPNDYSLENIVEAYASGEVIDEYSPEMIDQIEEEYLKEMFGLETIELHEFEHRLIQFCQCFVGQEVSRDRAKNSFNCSTFVRFVFKELLNIDISEKGYGGGLTARIMTSSVGKNIFIGEYNTNEEKIKFIKENAQIGDFLFFHTQSINDNVTTETNYYPGHIGIYLGGCKYIDARYNRGNIAIVDILSDNYLTQFVGLKSILPTLFQEKVRVK